MVVAGGLNGDLEMDRRSGFISTTPLAGEFKYEVSKNWLKVPFLDVKISL